MIGSKFRGLGACLALALAMVAAALPSGLHAQPVSQWAYSVNPTTGNGQAVYPGDVQLKLQGSGCAQFDASGYLTSTGSVCAGGVSLNVPNTWTATQTFTATNTPDVVFNNMVEASTVQTLAAGGTIQANMANTSTLFYTVAATANWTLNFEGNGSTSVATYLGVNQSATFVMCALQGASAFYNNAITVDGTATGVSVFWQGGTAPSAGNANGYDCYTYSVLKTAATPTYTIFASQTQF